MYRRLVFLAALCALLVPDVSDARVINIEMFRRYIDSSGRESFTSEIDTTNFHASSGDTIIAIVPDRKSTQGYYGLVNFNPPKDEMIFEDGVITIKHAEYDSIIIDEGVVVLTNAQFRFNGNARIGRLGGQTVKFIATGMRTHRSASGGTVDKRAGIVGVNNIQIYGLESEGFGGDNYEAGGGIMLAYGAKALICDSKTRNLIGFRAPFISGSHLPQSGEITIRTERCTFSDSVTNFFIDLDEGITYHDEGSRFNNKESWLKFGKFRSNGRQASQYDTATTSYLNTYGRFTASFSGSDVYQQIVDYILNPWKPVAGDPDFVEAIYKSLQRVTRTRIMSQSPTSRSSSDFNASGRVDFDDFFLFAESFGQQATGNNAKFDLDGSGGVINFDDFFKFAEMFGQSTGQTAGKVVAAPKPVVATAADLERLMVIAAKSPEWRQAVERLLGSRLPRQIELAQNYPNPFNPATTISYSLPQPEAVRLVIYNLTGQTVRTLVAASQLPGEYKINWNATDDSGRKVATGIYIYQLTAGSYAETRRMLLVK